MTVGGVTEAFIYDEGTHGKARPSGITYPGSPTLGYGYDAHGRLSNVTSSLTGTWATLADTMLYQPATDRPYARRLGNGLAR